MARPETEPKTPLAARLREVRRRTGDPERDEFANSLGISKSTIAHYERGERTPDAIVLDTYRSKFGVNINWLVSGEGEMFEDTARAINNAPAFQAQIVKKLARMVMRLHREASVKLQPEDVASEAILLYNDLAGRVNNLADTEEVDAVLPQVELQLKRRLLAAQVEPGSGKQQAS